MEPSLSKFCLVFDVLRGSKHQPLFGNGVVAAHIVQHLVVRRCEGTCPASRASPAFGLRPQAPSKCLRSMPRASLASFIRTQRTSGTVIGEYIAVPGFEFGILLDPPELRQHNKDLIQKLVWQRPRIERVVKAGFRCNKQPLPGKPVARQGRLPHVGITAPPIAA